MSVAIATNDIFGANSFKISTIEYKWWCYLTHLSQCVANFSKVVATWHRAELIAFWYFKLLIGVICVEISDET